MFKTFIPAFFALILTSVNSAAQDYIWGIGLKLGSPSGITLKKYMTETRALELSIGRTYNFDYNDLYNKRFDSWYKTQNYGYKDFQYLDYAASTPIGIQLHYLFHKNINSIGEETITGLRWYYGFGGQLRFQNYTFDYRYKLDGSSDWVYMTGEKISNIDIGADGVIGLEYGFENVPLSVFIDITLFMEIADNPFSFYLPMGIGIRYNF